MTRAHSLLAALLPPLALMGCATPAPMAERPPVVSAPAYAGHGLETVLGKDARMLVSLFGEPDQDVREDRARKLQFTGPACVLDAYLYPREGARDAVVTWLDARTPQGADFDRASCVAALSRRGAAR